MISLLIKSQLWLQFVVWARLGFQKSFVNSFYNNICYIHLLIAVLQADIHKIVNFSFYFFFGFFSLFFFCLFFLWLLLSEISAIITAAATFSWLFLLQLLNAEYSVRTTFMNSVWTTCFVRVETQWKSENRSWVIQIVSYKSFNIKRLAFWTVSVLNLEQVFWKTKTFSKKLEYGFFTWKYYGFISNISIKKCPVQS